MRKNSTETKRNERANKSIEERRVKEKKKSSNTSITSIYIYKRVCVCVRKGYGEYTYPLRAERRKKSSRIQKHHLMKKVHLMRSRLAVIVILLLKTVKEMKNDPFLRIATDGKRGDESVL